MQFRKIFLILFVFIFLTGCSQKNVINKQNVSPSKPKSTATLFQVSTLQALMQGYYYPVSTIVELKENGDFGIGCFEGVNGELIMLDGIVYQAIYDGSLQVPDNNTSIPYATVSFFKNDIEKTVLKNIKSINNLVKRLNKIVAKKGKNLFYFVKIEGIFDKIKYRSEYAQKEPYKPLAKAMETDQTFFERKKDMGTIVGLFCPDFMDKLNSTGWHFHYVNAERNRGGHLLEVSSKRVTIELSKNSNFKMKLPDSVKFQKLPLSKDMSKDLNKVEKGK